MLLNILKIQYFSIDFDLHNDNNHLRSKEKAKYTDYHARGYLNIKQTTNTWSTGETNLKILV